MFSEIFKPSRENFFFMLMPKRGQSVDQGVCFPLLFHILSYFCLSEYDLFNSFNSSKTSKQVIVFSRIEGLEHFLFIHFCRISTREHSASTRAKCLLLLVSLEKISKTCPCNIH